MPNLTLDQGNMNPTLLKPKEVQGKHRQLKEQLPHEEISSVGDLDQLRHYVSAEFLILKSSLSLTLHLYTVCLLF